MAKKRHHHSMHHEKHESMHKPSHHSRYREGYYDGPEMRRSQEMQDAGMIRENPAAIANMPQEVMIKPWPDGGSYMPEHLDDTISGINRQVELDDSKRNMHLVPKKV
jgi:hypothetical protein